MNKKTAEKVEEFRVDRAKRNKRITGGLLNTEIEVAFFGRPEERDGVTYKHLFLLTDHDLTPRAKAALEVLAEEHDKAIANFLRARDKAAVTGGGIIAEGNGKYGHWDRVGRSDTTRA